MRPQAPKAAFTFSDVLYLDAVALGCFPKLGTGDVVFWRCQCMDHDHSNGPHGLITPGSLEAYRIAKGVE